MFQKRLNDLILEKCDGKQTTLSKLTGISQSTISCYFTRGSSPSIEQLLKLADALDVTTDYLLGREDDFGIVTAQTSVPTLSKAQQTIVDIFSQISTDAQYEIIGFAKGYLHRT